MGTNHPDNSSPERRSEPRILDWRFYSVQFTTEGLDAFYQFKLWNISPNGMCILVKEGSSVLKHITVGDTIDMTYYVADSKGACENRKTQIKHISQGTNGRFQGHCLVGLAII